MDPAKDGGLDVSIMVKNTGQLRGDEVPQVYLTAPSDKLPGIQFAPKTLAAFSRISLDAGEEREISLHIFPRAFQYWSDSRKQWVKPEGARELLVGTSSRALPLRMMIKGR